MKTLWPREVRELLVSSEFTDWFRRFRELRRALVDARIRREDLLTQAVMVRFRSELTQQAADDKLFEGGEAEDLSARSHAEFAQIENDSFEVLSAFEMQRRQASDSWMDMDRTEQSVEEARQRASELRARMDAANKIGSSEAQLEAERLGVRLHEVELLVAQHAAVVEEIRQRLQREEERREELWLAVEAAWSSAFRANMARTEFAFQGRRVKAEAEALFAKAAQERHRVEELEQEAERAPHRIAELETELEAVIEEARGRFGCCLVREFLYWMNREDVTSALCVPVIEERKHLNIQVSPLQVYKIDRARGLEFIEPMPEPSDDDKDEVRLSSFFCEGRPMRAPQQPELVDEARS